jgi:SM-20-related protein
VLDSYVRERAVPEDARTYADQSPKLDSSAGKQGLTITRLDNVLREDQRKAIYDFLRESGWKFGWESRPDASYPFWHKHFAGHVQSDHPASQRRDEPYDCADELRGNASALHALWDGLNTTVLKGHMLVRCHADGFAYGSVGSLQTDSASPNSFTTIYHPHDRWSPNWGGETVFFDQEEGDIVASVYPKPNRLVVFPGVIPHVARGVSRICPVLRITLFFKTVLRQS